MAPNRTGTGLCACHHEGEGAAPRLMVALLTVACSPEDTTRVGDCPLLFSEESGRAQLSAICIMRIDGQVNVWELI